MNNKNICPHCKKGILEKVLGDEPYTEDHYQCNKCDSTFNLEEVNL
jgi:transposase-like protein